MTFCRWKSTSWIFLFFYKTSFLPFTQNFVKDPIKAAGKLRWMKLSRTAGDLVELGCCLAKAQQIGSSCGYRFTDNFKSRKKGKLRHITLRQLTHIMDNITDKNTSKVTLVIEDKIPWVSDWYSPRSEIVRLYSLIIDKCTSAAPEWIVHSTQWGKLSDFFVKSKPNYLRGPNLLSSWAHRLFGLTWNWLFWIWQLIGTALKMFCLSAIMSWVWCEVKAVNTEALLMRNDSCIANNTDWVGSSVCM